MFKKVLLTTLLALVSIYLLAQGRVGSPYTRYGIGDIYDGASARSISMGGLSYTLPYENDINFINPAKVAGIDSLRFIFDFGLNGGSRTYKSSNPEISQTKYDMHLSHIKFGFSAFSWWKMAFGILPYSDVGYNVVSNDKSLNVSKDFTFVGDGGVSKLFFSNGFIPFKNFKVGATASFIFGKMYQSNAIIFNDDSGSFLNIYEQNAFYINDFTFDFGLNYDISINKDHTLSIGAIYGHNSKLNAERSTIIWNTLSSSSATDTVFSSDKEIGTIGLPTVYGFGLGYSFKDKLYLGADFSTQNWSSSDFFGEKDNSPNSISFAFGGEYIPAGRYGTTLNYRQKINYRAGINFNKTYFDFATGEVPINDFGISFGVGLPTKRSQTTFNVALELGQRGSLENNLIKESYAIISVSFNLVETWFLKSKFD